MEANILEKCFCIENGDSVRTTTEVTETMNGYGIHLKLYSSECKVLDEKHIGDICTDLSLVIDLAKKICEFGVTPTSFMDIVEDFIVSI